MGEYFKMFGEWLARNARNDIHAFLSKAVLETLILKEVTEKMWFVYTVGVLAVLAVFKVVEKRKKRTAVETEETAQ